MSLAGIIECNSWEAKGRHGVELDDSDLHG